MSLLQIFENVTEIRILLRYGYFGRVGFYDWSVHRLNLGDFNCKLLSRDTVERCTLTTQKVSV
jgi:hypothetical protein